VYFFLCSVTPFSDNSNYHLEISLAGYRTLYCWVKLPAKDQTFSFTLESLPLPVAVEPPVADRKKRDTEPNPPETTTLDTIRNDEDKKTDWTEKTTGMEFVWIEGGCFMMGSPENEENRNYDEQQHEVCVDGFWMGKYEVTNRQYRRFKPDHDSKKFQIGTKYQHSPVITSEDCEDESLGVIHFGHPEYMTLNEENQPVVEVSWQDARKYAAWLSSISNTTIVLPSEEQWEYAARAGTTTTRFWGNEPERACEGYANVYDRTIQDKTAVSGWVQCSDGYAVSAPVGSFKQNPFGLYDMLGNVWEWCTNELENPGNSKAKKLRAFRGGGWYYLPAHVRSAHHLYADQDSRAFNIGFRLVRINPHGLGHNQP
jgi:formylglycine-generating enzyme required for sulfatase activity